MVSETVLSIFPFIREIVFDCDIITADDTYDYARGRLLTLSSGVDHVKIARSPDIEKGEWIKNVKINSASVVEYVLFYLIAYLRDFERRDFRGRNLSSQNIGIVGDGAIGSLCGAILKMLGATTCVSSDGLLGLNSSNILIICCPLTDSTKGLLRAENSEKFDLIINVSRPEIIESLSENVFLVEDFMGRTHHKGIYTNHLAGRSLDIKAKIMDVIMSHAITTI